MIKKRKKVRLISFLTALTLVLSLSALTGNIKAYKYKREADIENQRSLTELCEYMDSIEVSLMKSIYASSGMMLGSLTNKLQRDTSGAKESLSSLATGENELFNTYRFLSQVGEFTAYLGRKVNSGEEISAKERETLKKLSQYAAELSLKFQHMASLLSADYFTFDEVKQQLMYEDSASESMVSYADSIADAEMTFEDYPTLIYDGPFSDNILTKESVLLSEAQEITLEEAKKKAAQLLNTDERFFVEEENTDGKTAAYCFRTDKYSISITKKGGYPLEIMSTVTAGEEKLTSAEAKEKASLFLNECGYLDMTATYSAANDGICTVNFACKQGSFICYPDLIKVSVSLTDGNITGLEATDYIMNHYERDIPGFSVTPEEAAKGLPSSLRVKEVSAAVIPANSTEEKYTYELFCEDTDGQHILIYKDITTGEEADILILLYSDNGTLTK